MEPVLNHYSFFSFSPFPTILEGTMVIFSTKKTCLAGISDFIDIIFQ